MEQYYIIGGYKGMTEKYGKKITPYFNTYNEALHYQQCYRVFSESLSKGTIKKTYNA